MRSKLPILVAAAVVVSGLIVYLIIRSVGDEEPVETPEQALFERPMPWLDVADARPGIIDPRQATLSVGEVTLATPQPAGVKVSWKHQRSEGREVLTGTGAIAGHPATFHWSAASGNPHTVFAGEVTAKRSDLTEPLTSVIELPDGELTYVDAMLARVPFANAPIELSGLTSGPIVWRNGTNVIALWQWSADRITLAPSESGGVQVQIHWWDPELHPIPERCADELGEVERSLRPQLTISFGEVPKLARARLPDGTTSAVVPIFVDPHDADDARFQDGASGSAEDFVKRARTIAFGHSSKADARYGNGGLAGLDVGGTIVVPPMYASEEQVFEELASTMKAAEIELVEQSQLRPSDCAALVEASAEPRRALLGESKAFDGKFPNLFSLHQRPLIPGFSWGAPMWRPTALTGRRKDVVTQALSSTYLTRLADVRGLALLEIPIVATRNPLVAVAAESLLEPERNGEWTIEESVARALAEVELLSENERFDFIGMQRFAAYVAGARQVEVEHVGGDAWTVFNRGASLDGFTLVIEGEVDVTVDESPVETATRTLGNGAKQTWVWWDLAEGAPYELRLSGRPLPRAVEWSVSE